MALTKAVELSQIAGTLTSDSSGNTTLTGSVTASSFITGGTALLDSSRATSLIDSAYIQARQVDLQRDSGFVTGIIDSDYISLRAKELDNRLDIISTEGNDSPGPVLALYRNSASPAVNDEIGHIYFQGENDAGEKILYGEISTSIADETDGTEDARIELKGRYAGVFTTYWQGKFGQNAFARDVMLSTNVDLIFEGSTNDGNETTLTVTDPTADRTITLPDATGTVALTSDVKDSAFVTGIIDSSYIQARDRYRDSNFVTSLVDSAYIQLRDRFQDSAGITAIIDSAYVTARAPAADGDGLAFAIALG